MNDKELFSQFKELKKITPAKNWREESFRILEHKIAAFIHEEKRVSFRPSIIAVFREFLKEMPLQVAPLVILFIFFVGGGVLALNSAKKSLPGNFLYPVKLNLEKAKMALTGNNSQRATFSMELAKLRVRELDKIILEMNGSQAKSQKAEIVANTIKENINRVKQTVKRGDISRGFNFKIALSLASTTTEIKETINKSKDKLSSEAKDSLKEAVNSAEETGIQALVQSIDTKNSTDSGTSDSQEESSQAVELLKSKIENLQKESERIFEDFKKSSSVNKFSEDDISTMQEVYEAVEKLLDESKTAIDSENYEKITENSSLIMSLLEKMEKILIKYDATKIQAIEEPKDSQEFSL